MSAINKGSSMSKNIKTIHDLLAQYNELIINQRDKGTSFERLMKSYLELDPIYQDQFKAVFMWSEWPYKLTGHDHGIDLVAESHDGEFTAIQCKFFSPNHQILKGDIDSFFTESGKTFLINGKKKSFAQRIIISTSDKWSDPAEKALDGQTIPVIRIHIRELEQSPIDWSKFKLGSPEKLTLKDKKSLRPHQEEAIKNVMDGYKKLERGKLIMACGTGKTFTALKLAEKVTKKDGLVLFLVPSISLLSQTLREWTAESETSFHAFAVCSDSKVGKHKEDISKHDLAIPASTDTSSLLKGLERVKGDKKMSVIFSTYQSIDVISKAQKKGLDEFDIIICDEAHRTTGATAADQEDSHFVKIHDQKFIQGKKRLYMTATPRIFGDAVKTKAQENSAELYSMDNEKLFGPEFHRLGFGKAVGDGLLTDYKVLVLAIDEGVVGPTFQKGLSVENGEMQLEEIAKVIGCWNGLSKRLIGKEAAVEDDKPMRRAVAFARSIKDSEKIVNIFDNVIHQYIATHPNIGNVLKCELAHVDGTFNVMDRNAKLDWLKEETPENTCRILSNARCLSEGVDVPSLDAVLFLNSRDSMVDVVQSVGRIMRKADGKKYGYVILPIGIPAGISPDEALKDNKKYKVVWQVLQALRAHDDRFDAEVNKLELNKNKSSRIQVIVGGGDYPPGENGDGDKPKGPNDRPQVQLLLNMPQIEDWKSAIYGKIVAKCGTRPYWENWAADVAKIAEKHTKQIQIILKSKDPKPKQAFETFLNGIRKNLNPSISETDAMEMLSQQLITKPVFDALFEHYKFTEKNSVSQSMDSVLKVFEAAIQKEDAEFLKHFYASVRMRVKGINNAEARQRVIKELYDRFFNVAFKKMSERLGIVYTPIEVVDFIINSVESVMKDEFGKSLSNKGVQILDPFTGTGTFIVRLLQSGIIKKEDLKRKFQSEIHTNELVLLAYYIASVNIEETFHELIGGDYIPFEGSVLTDTFQLNEDSTQVTFASALPKNHQRSENQKSTKIDVIISNPPYSAGQADVNDNNQNIKYKNLDERIKQTYAKESTAKNKNSLYDSYIRSLRWATDRLGDEGIIGFVTNGSFIDAKAADGIRKSLKTEFSKMYCFNLRGNQYTSGEESLKEGGKIFGSGSRATIAITILIRKKNEEDFKFYYYDIGDYHTKEKKLQIISDFISIKSVPWVEIKPNNEGDWINQRTSDFEKFLPIYEASGNSIFSVNSLGINTSRDAWIINYDSNLMLENVEKFIQNYNNEVKRYSKFTKKDEVSLADFVNKDKKNYAWSSSLLPQVGRGKTIKFDKSLVQNVLYKPFNLQSMYYDEVLIHRTSKTALMFPKKGVTNKVISITGLGIVKDFSTIVSGFIPASKLTENGQCFPLYFYEEINSEEPPLIKSKDVQAEGYIRRDAITDFAKIKFQETYNDTSINKEDIFNYVYGLFHHPGYKLKYKTDLRKVPPRIPYLKDFWAISSRGAELSNLHLNYENVKPFDLIEEVSKGSPKAHKDLYRVNEAGMKFPKKNKIEDRSSIIFNPHITLKGIPSSAYDYLVNGKSGIEWVMEKYAVSKDKESCIPNDPNTWSDDSRFVIDLVKKVVQVSVETVRIINEFPVFELK
jgi:predicted helicase